MTPEAKRIKIAEARGWKWKGSVGDKLYMWPPIHGDCCAPPDYFKDLNATHELENSLPMHPNAERARYLTNEYPRQLWKICGFSWPLAVTATAAQRAEAFGLTLGLWKEAL